MLCVKDWKPRIHSAFAKSFLFGMLDLLLCTHDLNNSAKEASKAIFFNAPPAIFLGKRLDGSDVGTLQERKDLLVLSRLFCLIVHCHGAGCIEF